MLPTSALYVKIPIARGAFLWHNERRVGWYNLVARYVDITRNVFYGLTRVVAECPQGPWRKGGHFSAYRKEILTSGKILT